MSVFQGKPQNEKSDEKGCKIYSQKKDGGKSKTHRQEDDCKEKDCSQNSGEEDLFEGQENAGGETQSREEEDGQEENRCKENSKKNSR